MKDSLQKPGFLKTLWAGPYHGFPMGKAVSRPTVKRVILAIEGAMAKLLRSTLVPVLAKELPE